MFVFVLYLYTISNIRQAAWEMSHSDMSAVFVPIMTSANVIICNSSVNKKLILWYILNTTLSFLLSFANKNFTYKATAELLCVSEQHNFVFWTNRLNQWVKDSLIKESCLLYSWMNQPFEQIEWKTHKDIYPTSWEFQFFYLEYYFIKK